MARRSARQKLIGWGAFAAMLVVVVAIISVIRLQGDSAPAPAATSPAVAQASAPAALADALTAAAALRAASDGSPAQGPASSEPASSPSSAATSARSSGAASMEAEVAVVDASTMDQQSRRGLLLTLIQQGVFTGVEALGTPPKVGVTPLFEGLSPSLQQQFIAVVYAYINNGATGTQTLQLIDATNGSQVGSYSASDGLKLG